MWRLLIVLLVACKPSGVTGAEKLCAKATAIYEQCEREAGVNPQDWELEVDRWRGLCRAVITGETKQLQPMTLQIYAEMSDEVKAGLRLQAECMAKATTCDQYRACEQ